MGVHYALHVDLADAFDGADEVGVLAQQVAWIRGFHVLFGEWEDAAAVLLQQTNLAFGEDAALGGHLLCLPLHGQVNAKRQPVALPDSPRRVEGDAQTATSII